MGDEASRLAGMVGVNYATLYDSLDQVVVDQWLKLPTWGPPEITAGGVSMAGSPPRAFLDASERVSEACYRIRDWETQRRDEFRWWPVVKP